MARPLDVREMAFIATEGHATGTAGEAAYGSLTPPGGFPRIVLPPLRYSWVVAAGPRPSLMAGSILRSCPPWEKIFRAANCEEESP